MRQHHAGFASFACFLAVTLFLSQADAFEWLGARRADWDRGARAMAVVGNRAFVATGDEGVSFTDTGSMDVFNMSTNPWVLIKSVPTASTARGVAVAGTYVYVVSGTFDEGGGALEVVDYSVPGSAHVVGSVALLYGARGIALSGDYAYVATCETVADSSALDVVDISVATAPQVVASVPFAGRAYGVVVAGGHAYVAVADSAALGRLEVVDISTPTLPQSLGSALLSANEARGVTVRDDYAYVAVDTLLDVVDISVPASPAVVASAVLPTKYYAKAVAVLEDFAYVAANLIDPYCLEDYCVPMADSGAVEVIDIRVPTDPIPTVTVVGYWAELGSAQGFAVTETGYVYTAWAEITNYWMDCFPATCGPHLTTGSLSLIDTRIVCDPGGPYEGMSAETIYFDGSGSMDLPDIPASSIVSWDWDFGDSTTGSGEITTHAYADPGFYTVTLTVTEDEGITKSSTTTALIKEQPICDAGGPYAGLPGEPVLFDGSGSYDRDGTVVFWGWDFGDSTTGSGQTVQHTYAGSGAYTVTLTVTDNDTLTSTCQTTANIGASFTDIGADLIGLVGTSAFGDYDSDGDLDILLAGTDSTGAYVTRLYRNDAGDFNDIGAALAGGSTVDWGDYDGDGDLDILLTGWVASERVSKIYRNDAGAFHDIAAGLVGVSGAALWGDNDHDGDLDVLLAGDDGAAGVSRIYRNDAGSFADIGAWLTGITCDGRMAWGDYDNDADRDLLVAGTDSASAPVSLLLRNDDGVFTDAGVGLPGTVDGSFAWGDPDNDGDLDILLTGETEPAHQSICRIYRNDAGSFVDAAQLPGVAGAAAWGDYDNDGDLDVLLAGVRDQTTYVAEVYRNDGMSFRDIEAGLAALSGSVAWSDVDRDGDLDVLLAGRDSLDVYLARLYANHVLLLNTPPEPPTNLQLQIMGNRAIFSWDPATDAQTPAEGLSYNLRIGTVIRHVDVLPPMADPTTGLRTVVGLGNMNQNTSWTIDLPEPLASYYFWSVQAIDASFEGSAFAPDLFIDPEVTAIGGALGSPLQYALYPCAPNPFDRTTLIRYDLPRSSSVDLRIYDVAGRLVRQLESSRREPGRHAAVWDSRDDSGSRVASGVYFYRLDTGEFTQTRKVVFLR
jgi:PKD repeat protein